MHGYSVFGASLHSEVDLPELRPARDDAPARWALRIASNGHPPSEATLLGTDAVMPGVDVRLHRLGGGDRDGTFRLSYDDTGFFDISRDGRDIAWCPAQNAWIGAVRLDVIARVLPLALHAAGTFCLHASAVAIDGSAIAFIAPRGYGKSTLALALTARGARILTDDTLALDTSTLPVIAWPGVHSVRLMDDAASVVVGDATRLQDVGAYPLQRRDTPQLREGEPVITKQILRGLPDEKLMFASVPLAAVYLLTPTAPRAEITAATRARLPAVRAAVSLVEHAKLGVMLGRSEAPVLFERAVRVAQHVPVYQLTPVRDLGRIGDVVEQISTWHRAGTTA